MKRVITIALVLVLVFSLSISALALDSPSGKKYYGISVSYSPSDGSLGTASADSDKVLITEHDDGTVTLTAVEKGNGVFSAWQITGDYDIVSGSLTDKTITIRPHSDISAVATFTKPGSTPDEKPTTPGNKNNTSPKTGDPLLYLIGLLVLGLGAGTLAVKKIKE